MQLFSPCHGAGFTGAEAKALIQSMGYGIVLRISAMCVGDCRVMV